VFLIETSKDEQGKEKRTAKQVFVTTGATRGDQVAILKGIKEGDTIVTSGQIKLRNGSPVLINNTVQPNNDAVPQANDL
jgi:membrane fusion protein (multidrug efflux system)